MTTPSYINDNTMNYDELYDEDIGGLISECLSSTNDSDDTPTDDYIYQPNSFVTALEQLSPQLITSAVPVSSLSSRLSNANIIPPASISSMSESSRNENSSCDESVTGEKKVERRKRNREHAKKSRMRKKQFHEDLMVSVSLLQDENEKLRAFIRQRLGDAEVNHVLSSESLQKMHVERGTVHTARALISNKTLTLRLPKEHNQKHVTISFIS